MNRYLAERRKELGLTQLEVAEAVEVSEATVSRWESGGIANMRRDKIAAYAKVLQTSTNFIMTGEKEEQRTVTPCSISKAQTFPEPSPSPLETELLSVFGRLDEIDQSKVLERAQTLLDSEKYSIQEQAI